MVVAVAIVVSIPLLAFLIACVIKGRFPNLAAMSRAEWVTFLGGGLAYVGTCGMGLLALWQNIVQKQENTRSQERLEAVIKNLSQIEEERDRPILGVTWYTTHELRIKNYKTDPALSVRIKIFPCQIYKENASAQVVESACINGNGLFLCPVDEKIPDVKNAELTVKIICKNCSGAEYREKFRIRLGQTENIYFSNQADQIQAEHIQKIVAKLKRI